MALLLGLQGRFQGSSCDRGCWAGTCQALSDTPSCSMGWKSLNPLSAIKVECRQLWAIWGSLGGTHLGPEGLSGGSFGDG